MCGFAGFIDFNKKSDLAQLAMMNDVIQHRGPDAEDYFFDDQNEYIIGLGHRRLSIIDLHASANQPMCFKDLIIVFNGEIYNYQEIKKELVARGRDFKTQSDTEVILHSFDEWGDACVHKFIGMFAFLIFDKNEQEISVFRDRPGVKPFHYYWDQHVFLFASEIKSFHQHPQFKKEIDFNVVANFLQYGYIHTPDSIFKNVKKLPGGCLLKFNLKSQNINVRNYWDVDDYYEKPKLDISFEEAKIQTEAIIKNACAYRMIADVPVGVFLSGGYDSTLVTSILQSNNSQKIKTFTIGVEDQQLNEASFAKEIAQHLGTDHTELYCTEKEMFDLIEKLPFHFDEPFGDSSAIPTMLVSKLARRDIKVALSADGGDEVFAGYNRYDYLPRLHKLQILSKLPLPFNLLINLFVNNEVDAHRFKRLLKDPTTINLADLLNSAFQINNLQKLFKYPLSKEIFSKKDFENKNIRDNLSQIMAYDYKTYLLDDILTKVDRATMSASLEGREPLLDHRLIEFAAQLPNEYKYNKGTKKFILKEITHQFVSKKIMERPKMGFAVPVFSWLQSSLKDKLDYYLSKPFIQQQGIFNFEEINNIKARVLNRSDKYFQKLWYILMFQMWYGKWILNEK